jgi:hypothetical protein
MKRNAVQGDYPFELVQIGTGIIVERRGNKE